MAIPQQNTGIWPSKKIFNFYIISNVNLTGANAAQQTSDFISKNDFNTVMNAGMVFKDENEGVRSLIDEKQLIAYDSIGGKVDKVTDVADAWDSDEGILLQLNGLNLPGEYSSELTWTLVDSDM